MPTQSPNGGKRATKIHAEQTGWKKKRMNWDQIEGKWKQFTGSARARWGRLTENDWLLVAGKKDQLIGRIQERYGVAKKEAEKQADDWSHSLKEAKHKAREAAH